MAVPGQTLPRLPFDPASSCDNLQWSQFWEEFRLNLHAHAPAMSIAWRLDSEVGVHKIRPWYHSPLRASMSWTGQAAASCLHSKDLCCMRCPVHHRHGGWRCSIAILSIRLFAISYTERWTTTFQDQETFQMSREDNVAALRSTFSDLWTLFGATEWNVLLFDSFRWPILPFLQHAALAMTSADWQAVFQSVRGKINCSDSNIVKNLLGPALIYLKEIGNYRIERIMSANDRDDKKWSAIARESMQSIQSAVLSAYHQDPITTMQCSVDLWALADQLTCDPVVHLRLPAEGFKMWVPPYRDWLAEHVRGLRVPHCSRRFQEEVHLQAQHRNIRAAVLVDVGAAFGDCSLWACAEYDWRVKMFSYEPVEEAMSALSRSVQLNPFMKCSIKNRHIALDARPGAARSLSAPSALMGGARLNSLSAREDPIASTDFSSNHVRQHPRVAVETLDHEAEYLQWDYVDVLKVHVNGLELQVLLGGEKVLHRTRSVVVKTTTHAATHEKLIALLCRFGFSIIHTSPEIVARRSPQI